MELIKRRADGNGIVRKTYHFVSNDKVRIKSGLLKNLLGFSERWVSESENVRVLLNLVGDGPTLELHCPMLERNS